MVHPTFPDRPRPSEKFEETLKHFRDIEVRGLLVIGNAPEALVTQVSTRENQPPCLPNARAAG